MVPIKDNIPINKINSKKACVWRNTEKIAIPEIKLMPMASSACTRSALEGPRTSRNRLRRIATVRIVRDKIINVSNILPCHILYSTLKDFLRFQHRILRVRYVHGMNIKTFIIRCHFHNDRSRS